MSLTVDFAIRRDQVLHYLDAVGRAEKGLRRSQKAEDVARVNVLRAGTFLILYNLVEASLRASIEAIHDAIVSQAIPFQQLRESIRRDVMRSFKTRLDPDIQKNMVDVPVELVAVALDVTAGYPFSGNVDAKKVREVADIYGFQIIANPSDRNGADLLTIKTARNDLAHGLKTYEEVGRDYTTSDIKELSTRALGYVEAVLRGVDGFLAARDFNTPAVP